MDTQTIWLIPPSDIKGKLDAVVSRLAEKYNSPVFEPHMTLLGDVKMQRNEFLVMIRELASDLAPFSLTLGEVSFSTTFFQSVFVRVRSTAPLMNANLKAKEIFGIENNVFMPHISLMYGEHSMKLREEAAASVELLQDNFLCEKLIVTQSSLNPSEWEHIT